MVRTSFLLLLFAPMLAAQSGGVVEGAVVDSLAHKGIPNVTVDLTPAGSKTVARTAITDAAGAFCIPGVPPGDYTVSAAKSGYGRPLLKSLNQSTAHIVGDGDTAKISFELMQLASISGRVTDAHGHPFAHMLVQLRTASELSRVAMLSTTETDKDGRYEFSKMWPGAYFLMAQPIESSLRASFGDAKSKKEEKQPLEPPPAVKGRPWMWVNTFYPDTADRTQAARIVVHAGWDMQGYDIHLQALPVYRVSGIVFGEDGKPAAGVSVGISAADRWQHDSTGATSKEDGTFELTSIHQGDWELAAILHRESKELRGFAQASVARHDLENIVIHLAAPFALAGTVERDDPRDAKGSRESVYVGVESTTHRWSASAKHTDASSFRLENVYPGRYRIESYGVVPGYYVASILLGDRDVNGQEVQLADGAPPIRIIYKPGAGRVRGSVEDGAGATVVLLPKDEKMLTAQFVRSAKCDSDGRYELGGLKPGDYYLLAFRQADLVTLEDADFVRPLAPLAVSVQVENDRIASVDLKLTGWPE